MSRNRLTQILPYCLFPLLLISSCVSIPREAPELSGELGKRISAIEDSHISLLRLFMDEKRTKVDDFLMKEWVPLFAEELFKEDAIKKAWSAICTSDSDEDKLKFLTMLGPKIQERINKKRTELIQPLDELELTIERKVRDEYTQARAINNSITSFLASASKVAESRDRYLNMLGIHDEKVSNALDEADGAVAELVKGTKDKAEKLDSFIEKVDGIIKKLKE
ncbi:MAG: hypothetical protein C4538_07370 [Nitrospiraceae bacterium]|nr:MAG: hypothetical protein C4538_07370 [Nitrospiraceae bacterium]